MKLRSGFCVGLAGFLSLAYVATADENSPLKDDRATVSLVYENDWVDGGRDRNYTNGIRLSYVSGTTPNDGLSKWVSRYLLGGEEDTVRRKGFAFGHSIFTPNDIGVEQPAADDHPYAAWLYGEYTLMTAKKDQVDQFSVQLGVVGPSAGGEWVQNEVHKLIGADEAKGWDNQINDEVGIILSYDRRLRSLWEVGDSRFGADITPSVGATVGNIQTNLRIGAMARVGQDLRLDYGPSRIRPALAGAGYFTPLDGLSWYIFAGVEGRYVAHDIFLDGSLFRDGPSVNSRDFVGDLQAGFALQFEDTQFAFTYIERTPEFDGQAGAHRFGAFTVSRKF